MAEIIPKKNAESNKKLKNKKKSFLYLNTALQGFKNKHRGKKHTDILHSPGKNDFSQIVFGVGWKKRKSVIVLTENLI